MKEYKYIYANEIESYSGWDIVATFTGDNTDMVIVMKEYKLIQDYIKLHEATDEQLIEELHRRLIRNNND